MSRIALGFLTLYIVGIIALCYTDVNARGIWGGIAAALRKSINVNPGDLVTSELASYSIGMVLPKVFVFLMLIYALGKCNKILYIICLVMFSFYSLGEIGNKHIPFVAVTFIVLLLTNPVRRYFSKKKVVLSGKFDFEGGKFESK